MLKPPSPKGGLLNTPVFATVFVPLLITALTVSTFFKSFSFFSTGFASSPTGTTGCFILTFASVFAVSFFTASVFVSAGLASFFVSDAIGLTSAFTSFFTVSITGFTSTGFLITTTSFGFSTVVFFIVESCVTCTNKSPNGLFVSSTLGGFITGVFTVSTFISAVGILFTA